MAEEVPLPSLKLVVAELPTACCHFSKTISIELADEAGEVAMLEEGREEVPGELGRLPDDEGGPGLVPRDHGVGGGVVHQHVGLQ